MGSFQNGVVGGDRSATAVDKGVDFAQYFCTYAFLYHQKEMLFDRVRMDAYFNSIFQNKHHFQGKTVLDVGTGSGILAIWSAQAGARKVYVVEATIMSEHAHVLIKANNFEDVVEVIEGSMEEVRRCRKFLPSLNNRFRTTALQMGVFCSVKVQEISGFQMGFAKLLESTTREVWRQPSLNNRLPESAVV